MSNNHKHRLGNVDARRNDWWNQSGGSHILLAHNSVRQIGDMEQAQSNGLFTFRLNATLLGDEFRQILYDGISNDAFLLHTNV